MPYLMDVDVEMEFSLEMEALLYALKTESFDFLFTEDSLLQLRHIKKLVRVNDMEQAESNLRRNCVSLKSNNTKKLFKIFKQLEIPIKALYFFILSNYLIVLLSLVTFLLTYSITRLLGVSFIVSCLTLFQVVSDAGRRTRYSKEIDLLSKYDTGNTGWHFTTFHGKVTLVIFIDEGCGFNHAERIKESIKLNYFEELYNNENLFLSTRLKEVFRVDLPCSAPLKVKAKFYRNEVVLSYLSSGLGVVSIFSLIEIGFRILL